MLEDQPNKVARSTKEKAGLPLEQEWEEFDDYDLTDIWPVDQPWLEIDSSSRELFQEDPMAEFSPEQELLFQKRFEENYDLPDPVYQQWLKINHPTAEVQNELQGRGYQMNSSILLMK